MKRVSVVLLCYNHAPFVEQAIQSVLSQDYPDVELIVIDDFSEDGSQKVIEDVLEVHPEVIFIRNSENLGNCKSFNLGYTHTTGDFIIDLSADDYFLPGKLKSQIEKFNSLSADYGVVFTDAELFDEQKKSLGTHMARVRKIGRIKEVPEGHIFPELLESYFISSPTQMIRREVFENLNGYDESLTYEDFDFWIRSSQEWKYAYLDKVLMGVRKLPGGMSHKMYSAEDKKVGSTLLVVKKASQMLRNNRDRKALLSRIKYEFRMAFKYHNREMLVQWFLLYKSQGGGNLFYRLLYWWRK